MNPQQQAPLDYLNQISTSSTKPARFGLTLRTVIIGAAAVVVLIIIMAIIVSFISNTRKTPWEQLSARLAVTSQVANDATTVLKSSQLRSLNSDLKLYLTNTTRDLETPLAQNGVNAKKLSPAVVTKENNTGITGRLEDARLNAKYDSAYAREMSYQLATILALYQTLYSSSGNTEIKTYLKTSYDNLLPTQKALADFSDSSE